TGALPNLIADYPVVPEYINDVVRPGSLLRWLERLSTDTAERRAMLDGFDLVWQNMQVHIPAGEAGAAAVLRLMQGKLR
ncbi:MAG: lipid disaccharide synthase, partial [Pseudomonadota bacterium]